MSESCEVCISCHQHPICDHPITGEVLKLCSSCGGNPKNFREASENLANGGSLQAEAYAMAAEGLFKDEPVNRKELTTSVFMEETGKRLMITLDPMKLKPNHLVSGFPVQISFGGRLYSLTTTQKWGCLMDDMGRNQLTLTDAEMQWVLTVETTLGQRIRSWMETLLARPSSVALQN